MVDISAIGQVIVLLTAVQMSSARGRPINIFAQKNGGDITQLRDNKGESKMFNALHRNSDLKWNVRNSDGNVVIPFRIVGSYDMKERKTISTAMKRLEDNTCIRFKDRTNERDYIEIQNQAGQGCYTTVGRAFGKSILMLEANYEETCMETHIVLHELMHVAGLWHEHMRYDRDKYIKVHYENIDRSYWNQFEKVSPQVATTYNIPYDYKSVMHYDKTSFAMPGRYSMETLDPRYQNVIGHQKDASPNDYRKICEIYQCKKCMNGNTGNSVKPQPSEEPFISVTEPSVEPKGECRDMYPTFCRTMASARMIDCRYFGRMQCCSTCAAIIEGKEHQSVLDQIFRFIDDVFKF